LIQYALQRPICSDETAAGIVAGGMIKFAANHLPAASAGKFLKAFLSIFARESTGRCRFFL
jgi:hypothetical protein